jgi:hypothetical protein
VAPLLRWLMAGIVLGPGFSASAPAWQWGDVAEIRSQAMTGRTQMRHYLNRPARRHGKPREWLPGGTA